MSSRPLPSAPQRATRRASLLLSVVVGLQVVAAFVLCAGGGLYAFAASRQPEGTNPFAGLGVALGLFVCVVGGVVGAVLLAALIAAGRGSALGRVVLVLIQTLVVFAVFGPVLRAAGATAAVQSSALPVFGAFLALVERGDNSP